MILQMKYLRFFLFFQLLVIGVYLQAQTSSCIKGKVVDAAGNQPIAFANINVSATYGTTSNETGQFELCNLPAREVKLSVSCLGYKQFDTIINSVSYTRYLIVKLLPIHFEMEEIVVTATRTDNYILETPVRVNLISPKMISNSPVRTVDEILKYL